MHFSPWPPFNRRGPMLKTAFFLLLAQVSAGQRPTLVWESFHPPEYPQVAQIAHITGLVRVEFTLDQGKVSTVQKITGHPLLIPAAEETIKASKLSCAHCENGTATFRVNFDFKFSDHDCDEAQRNSPYTAWLDSEEHISVIAEPVCTNDPIVVTVSRKVRSPRCLYLWRCSSVRVDDVDPYN